MTVDMFSFASQDGQSVCYVPDSRFYWEPVPGNSSAFPVGALAVETFVVGKLRAVL